MSKVKVSGNFEEAGVPPMPTTEKEVLEGSPSPSTSGEGEPQAAPGAVSEAFAGDLYKIPFQAWHIFNPSVPDEPDPRIVASVAPPFARVLEKYGLGKIAKDEILVAFYLTQTVYVYVKASKDAKRVVNKADVGKDEVIEN